MSDEKILPETAAVVQPVEETAKPEMQTQTDSITEKANLLVKALQLLEEQEKSKKELELKQKEIDENIRKYDPFYKAGKYAQQELGDMNLASKMLSDAKAHLKRVSENINLPVEEREEIIQDYISQRISSYKAESSEYEENLQAARDKLTGVIVRNYGERGAQKLTQDVKDLLSCGGKLNDQVDRILSILPHNKVQELVEEMALRSGLYGSPVKKK